MALSFFGITVDAATYLVTNGNDAGDFSLRWAINQANSSPGDDSIIFDSSYTIFPLTALPELSDTTGGTVIDGGDNTVVINGSGSADATNGIKIVSNNNIIRNLHIRNISRVTGNPYSGNGIWILGNNNLVYNCRIYLNANQGILLGNGSPTYSAADNNKVQSCYIGSSDGESTGQGNESGLYAYKGVSNLVIGVDGDGIDDMNEGNVISGNISGGLSVSGQNSRISGNLIGVNKTGTSALPNTGTYGIGSTGSGALIGTDGNGVSDALERNIISGNAGRGITINRDTRFSGNYVGVDITGSRAIPNGAWGVGLGNDSTNILVGTDSNGISDELERNIISGNSGPGIACTWSSYVIFNNVRISGNYIGTDATGTVAIGNTMGIAIYPIDITNINKDFIIGTNGDGVNDEVERNIISGNGTGIHIGPEHYYSGIQISGNYIGTDVTGIKALGNDTSIKLYRSTDNIIGTDGDGIADEAERNIIVASKFAVYLDDWYTHGAERNRISGNYLGTDRTGTVLLGDGSITAEYSHNNIIGTNGDGVSDSLEKNIIATSTRNGISLSYSTGNRISGNYIGLGSDGVTPLGTGLNGIYIASSDNTIIGTDGNGSSDNLESNTILAKGSRGNGIQISYSNNCRISGNSIGTDRSGILNSGFGGAGILLRNGDNNLIGTDWNGTSDLLEGNIIANNGYSPNSWWYETDGIAILGSLINGVEKGNYNAVRGNSTYGNTGLGIDLIDLANKQVPAPVIVSAAYTGAGLEVSGTASAGSTVEIFISDSDPSGAGEGKTYKGKTVAANGTFNVIITGVSYGDQITATATDISGNTSEFSVNKDIAGNRPPELAAIGDNSVNEGTLLSFNVSASDPDGNTVTISANGLPDGAGFDGNNFSWLPGYNQAGTYFVTFTAADNIGGFDSETITITVIAVNAPPAAAPSGSGTYHLGDDIVIDGQVSDADGDLLSYQWYEGSSVYCSGSVSTTPGGEAVSIPGCMIEEGLSVGLHTVFLSVSDGVNGPAEASVEISVIDTNAPGLAPVASTNICWPPNHQMIDVSIITNAYDDSGCFDLSADVTSSEPEDSLGDGDIAPDFTEPLIDQDSGTITLQLRSERSGKGDGRVYSITITATDCSNNSSMAVVEVTCPHDKKKK